MTSGKMAWRRAGLLATGLVLAGCTPVVVVDEPGPVLVDPGPAFCTREYDPVCARRGGTVRTFGNDCEAEAADYRVISDGECRRADLEPEETFCTREYDPVCARRGGNVRSFGNECEAEAAGFRVIADGPC